MLAVVTFTDPRKTSLSLERENALLEKHKTLINELEASGFTVFDVNGALKKYNSLKNGENFGVDSKEEVRKASKLIGAQDISGVIIGLWHWTESNLVTLLAKKVNKPLLLYADDDPTWAGTTCITSVGASLWESAVNYYALCHTRLKGDIEKAKAWVRAVEAVSELSRKSLLIWGAPYTLGMEHLMDDLPQLKRFIGDFLFLDQYLIVKRADWMLSDEKKRVRIEEFFDWLHKHATIKYDDIMLTPEALKRQIGIYLAAKDIWSEYEDETAAVSIKCQPELSEVYGVMACLIPALFPFNRDVGGEKPIIPATCEGDIKGTISSALLFYLSGKPPLFGDIKYVDDDLVLIANCGASSLYYAKLSENPEENLRATTIQGQCQGAGGGALTYRTPPTTLTVARLIRKGGEYYLLYFLAEGVEIDEEVESKLKWGRQWPHTAIKNPLDKEKFLNAMGANHLSAVPGDFRSEIEFAARVWGIRAINLEKESEVEILLHSI